MFNDILQRLGIVSQNSGVYAGRWIERPGGEEFVSINPATGQPLARVLGASQAITSRRSSRRQRLSRSGDWCRRRSGAKWCGRSATPCASTRATWACWSRWKRARSRARGCGEVQEMIDMCDFAVGLSRQLYGLTIASERPGHRMFEQWHPLGPVGVHHGVQFSGRGLGLERGAGRSSAAIRSSGSRRT